MAIRNKNVNAITFIVKGKKNRDDLNWKMGGSWGTNTNIFILLRRESRNIVVNEQEI